MIRQCLKKQYPNELKRERDCLLPKMSTCNRADVRTLTICCNDTPNNPKSHDESLLIFGARSREPGQFSLRAFINSTRKLSWHYNLLSSIGRPTSLIIYIFFITAMSCLYSTKIFDNIAPASATVNSTSSFSEWIAHKIVSILNLGGNYGSSSSEKSMSPHKKS